DDPFDDPAPAKDLPALADLPTLPALRALPDAPDLPALRALTALPPLGAAPTHTPPLTHAPAPAPAPAFAPAPAPPSLISLPAVPSATLGQYDEYQRPIAAFSIDASPVTVAAFQRCVAAGECTRPACASAPGDEARVTCVDLAQAKSYCAFAGERLPTEEEWEHAARQATAIAMQGTDDAAEWTLSPYCFFCGKDDEVVRGGPARNPALRGWRSPTTKDANVGFRCAKNG
ncbi:MAG: SUMF1/EgtB/PvdO family nonheme iron enzyme, partial [Polyangiaceae bacterium]